MVPAHYHASIGAVTAAFMAFTYPLLSALGAPGGRFRSAGTWQPALYGAGQMVFAAGFGIAGSAGMGRKTYGNEQHARGLVETIGLGVMGAGGLVAIAGGVLFLAIAINAWRSARAPRKDSATEVTGRLPWTKAIPTSIRSRS